MGDDNVDYMYDDGSSEGLYSALAVVIFVILTGTFLFPLNDLLPIDRRTVSIGSATLVYLCHAFLFPNKSYEIIDGVDFDVIILLAGIMVINFLLVTQPQTKKMVRLIQDTIKQHPRRGFWYVGLAAFSMSPFLTNDGVCLLFVAPVMHAFSELEETESQIPFEQLTLDNIEVKRADALYFMLNIACSSNIGSALTYIGNPQNMIVGQDALSVMPPYMFLGYMVIPSLLSFVITSFYLERCWLLSRKESPMNNTDEDKQDALLLTSSIDSPLHPRTDGAVAEEGPEDADQPSSILLPMSPTKRKRISTARPKGSLNGEGSQAAPVEPHGHVPASDHYSEYSLNAPFPNAILFLTIIMVICIFCEVMSIAGVILVFAAGMTIFTAVTNYWRATQVLVDETDGPQTAPLTRSQKQENLNYFFEELFASIDMNILLIFTGLFIVVDNLDSTGLPRAAWNAIVGKRPFKTTGSVIGISIFVLIASQTVGNVPVIQLAKPNVEPLDDGPKRFAWAILSFVSTVGGNLTLTGSAANVIVAEQVARLPGNHTMDFWKHAACCFWVTLLSCAAGMAVISFTVMLDASLSGYS